MKALALLLLALAACPEFPPKPPPVDGTGCEGAQLRMDDLHCAQPDGGFARGCHIQASAGMRIDTKCIVDAGNCDAVAECK